MVGCNGIDGNQVDWVQGRFGASAIHWDRMNPIELKENDIMRLENEVIKSNGG
jgi:hypothetical protein